MSLQTPKSFGQGGEERVSQFLSEKGWVILARNWHYKKAEIDIIAWDGPVLVFVEVKSKAKSREPSPAERLLPKQKRMIVDAAMAYMNSIGHTWEIRFDLVTLIGDPENQFVIHHYYDAFFPDLRMR